jgi:hypothetical protein
MRDHERCSFLIKEIAHNSLSLFYLYGNGVSDLDGTAHKVPPAPEPL